MCCALQAILFSSACAPRADTGLDSALASYNAGDFEIRLRPGPVRAVRRVFHVIEPRRPTSAVLQPPGWDVPEVHASCSNRPRHPAIPEIAGRAGVTLGTVLLDDDEPLQAARTFDSAATHLRTARTLHEPGCSQASPIVMPATPLMRANGSMPPRAASSGDLGSRAANEISRTGFTIQAGAFSSKDSAVAHATTVSTAARPRGMPTATVVKSVRNGKVQVARPDRQLPRSCGGPVQSRIDWVAASEIPT